MQEAAGMKKMGLVLGGGGATFPRQGGRLIVAPTDTTPEWGECQCPKPSPSRGKVARRSRDG